MTFHYVDPDEDPSKDKIYIYSGGTILPTTSGSAINPEYNSSFYRNAENFANVYKALSWSPDIQVVQSEIADIAEIDDKVEKVDKAEKGEKGDKYSELILNLYIEQMKGDILRDEDNYNRQKKLGSAIFFIVIFIVFCGLGFTAIQLFTALRFGDFSQLDSAIEIQQAGNIVLTTSLVGAVVLVISIVFFFLFLNYVYKPNNTSTDFLKKIKEIPIPK